MNMRNYMKKKEKSLNAASLTTDELIAKVSKRKFKLSKVVLIPILVLCVSVPIYRAAISFGSINAIEAEGNSTLALAAVPIAATTAKKDLISGNTLVNDVPKFDLVEPPDVVNENSDAARVMDTVVSGILYDKYSPSAILNIEGNDYLVKKGDVVNNYKVVNIMQDSVTVKLGNNTYKAGIGEILTEGSLTHNDVSNLNKKFGGERR